MSLVNTDDLGRKARECLARAGWTPRRRVDLDAYVGRLEEHGYEVFDVVREFLARFGGLRLRYPHFRAPNSEDSCHFDAESAVRHCSEFVVAKYAEAVGKPLCPFGEAFHDHMILMMTKRGVVYAAFEDTLVHIADSPVDAINDLCEGRDGHEQIALPGFFDDRESTRSGSGSAVDELLENASGATGPEGAVDLGMPGLFAELSALLSRRNGFTAFSGSIQVYRSGDPGVGPELSAWNDPATWSEMYGRLADNLFVFGQNLFGNQYCFDLAHGSVIEFDPEDGSKVFAGSDLEEWASLVFDPLEFGGWENLAKEYQEAHGALSADQRLVPIVPFLDGGGYEVGNLTVVDSAEAMRSRGAAAQRRHAG